MTFFITEILFEISLLSVSGTATASYFTTENINFSIFITNGIKGSNKNNNSLSK